MQPQMPYGAPPGTPQNPQSGPAQPYQNQPGYPAQPPAPYVGGAGVPASQSQYPQNFHNPANPYGLGQPPAPQYHPPTGYQAQPARNRPAPLPPPPPIQKTPYDFFMQQKHPVNTKSPIPGPRQAGFRGKLIWIAGAALAIVLVVVGISAFKPKDATIPGLITIAQTQQEVARVCGLGGSNVTTQPNRNLAINCTTIILSDQAKLLAYLRTQKIALKPKQLGLLASSSSDKSLTAAAASSNYDDTYKTLVLKQLTSYGALVQQQLASGTLGPNAQAILSDEVAHIKVLVGDQPAT